jgi:hypothetical protein
MSADEAERALVTADFPLEYGVGLNAGLLASSALLSFSRQRGAGIRHDRCRRDLLDRDRMAKPVSGFRNR